MKPLKILFIASTFMLVSVILLCTGEDVPNGPQGNNGLAPNYEGRDNSGLIEFAINFKELSGDSGNAIVTMNNVPVTYTFSIKDTSITFYDKASSVIVYKAQLNNNEISLQNAAGQPLSLLSSTDTTKPQDDTNTTVHSGKGVLHPKYKGVMSGSDTKIVFEDSSKTHGNVTFKLIDQELELTYQKSADSITFYAATVPTYLGILSETQIRVYLFTGTALLGTLLQIVQETGPLSGTYLVKSSPGTHVTFLREDGVDSALFYSTASSPPDPWSYRISKDTLILEKGSGLQNVCFLSDTKNAFWCSADDNIYSKDSTKGTGKIDVLSGVIPKSEYKCKESNVSSDLVRGIGFGTDSAGNNYYYTYKFSYTKNANIFEESGSYTFNTYSNKIAFHVDAKGCTDGSGNVAFCVCNNGTATMHSNTSYPFIVLNGESYYRE